MILISTQIWSNDTMKCVAKNDEKRRVSSLKVIKRYKRYIESKYPNHVVYIHFTENPKGLFGQ